MKLAAKSMGLVLAGAALSGCAAILGLDQFTEGGGGSAGAASSSSGQPAACIPGNQNACLYTGPAGTENVGVCHAGKQVCDAQGHSFGPCAGEVLPAPKEDCGNAIDDDCNGQPNDGCPCLPGTMEHCYTGPADTMDVGVCVGGMHTCNAEGNGYGACVGEVKPLTEDCATKADEDCDGVSNQASAGCVCMPTAMAACYSGPVGTSGVGLCKDGTRTCNADGLGYAGCVGDVLPTVESCSNATDEDCDGYVCGKTLWANALANITIKGVAVDGAGNVYVAGGLSGLFTLDAVSLSTVGGVGSDVVVLKFDPAGNIIWGKRFGSTSDDVANAIAVDAAGNVHLTGHSGALVDFGGGALTPAGVFVVKLSSAGNHIWSKGCGGGGADGNGIAVDGTGNVLVTGFFDSTLSCAGGQSVTSLGKGDVFVVRMSGASGVPIWTKGFGDAANQQLSYGIAAAANGDALITGLFFGSITFGGNTLVSPGSSSIFVAKLTAAAGAPLWSKGGGSNAAGTSIAVDAASNPVFTGIYSAATTFAGKTVALAGGGYDILLGKLDTATGNAIWLNGYGGVADDKSRAVAVNGAGRIAMGGEFQNSVDFGGGALAAIQLSAFLATFDAVPTHLWSEQFSSQTGASVTKSVAFGPIGEVVAGGQFGGTIDFGQGPLTAGGGATAFLIRVAP